MDATLTRLQYYTASFGVVVRYYGRSTRDEGVESGGEARRETLHSIMPMPSFSVFFPFFTSAMLCRAAGRHSGNDNGSNILTAGGGKLKTD